MAAKTELNKNEKTGTSRTHNLDTRRWNCLVPHIMCEARALHSCQFADCFHFTWTIINLNFNLVTLTRFISLRTIPVLKSHLRKGKDIPMFSLKSKKSLWETCEGAKGHVLQGFSVLYPGLKTDPLNKNKLRIYRGHSVRWRS